MTLGMGVLFSMFYVSFAIRSSDGGRIAHDPHVIPTQPKISQLQAIETVERHIRSEIKDVQNIRLEYLLYNYSSSEYNSDKDYADYRINMGYSWDLEHVKQYPKPLNLRLFFVSANNTVYAINDTSHSYQKICDKPSSTCAIGNVMANAVRDKLVYFMDIHWFPQSRDVPSSEGYVLIDAETGEIAWSSVEYDKDLKPMPNVNFDNKTVSQLYKELANPPQTTNVDIEYGAADQSAHKGYLPKEVRVNLGIDNKVAWTNRDNVPESVVSDSGYIDELTGKKFDSGQILPGGTFEFTFTKPGEYSYHAEPHPWMRGKVTGVENFS
jgi:plastocyanin